jgi:hypothetical protein
MIPETTMTFVPPRVGICSLLCERAEQSQFMMSVDATTTWNSKHMIDDDDSDDNHDDDASQEDDDDAVVRDVLAEMDDPFSANIDLDEFMVSYNMWTSKKRRKN